MCQEKNWCGLHLVPHHCHCQCQRVRTVETRGEDFSPVLFPLLFTRMEVLPLTPINIPVSVAAVRRETSWIARPDNAPGPADELEGEIIFDSLPPLFRGHPEVHLRNGIMNASRKTVANVLDAEKAFFVADLTQVYLQHQRWLRCLPDIEPHYGAHTASFSTMQDPHRTFCLSCKMQPGPIRP